MRTWVTWRGPWACGALSLVLLSCGRERFLQARDTRTAIIVPPAVRTAVLAEMRTMLGSVNGVLLAQARGDTAAIRLAAARDDHAFPGRTSPAAASPVTRHIDWTRGRRDDP